MKLQGATKMDISVFDMYFASLVSITLHPGYNRENATQPTLEDCAEMASEMIEVREKYINSTGER